MNDCDVVVIFGGASGVMYRGALAEGGLRDARLGERMGEKNMANLFTRQEHSP